MEAPEGKEWLLSRSRQGMHGGRQIESIRGSLQLAADDFFFCLLLFVAGVDQVLLVFETLERHLLRLMPARSGQPAASESERVPQRPNESQACYSAGRIQGELHRGKRRLKRGL